MNDAGRAVISAVRGACEGLLANYARHVRAAQEYTSPNPEDDEWVKLGIAAFSTYASTDLWTLSQFEYFCQMRAEEFTPDVLEAHGDAALPYERFGCLCIGAVLGLHGSGAIQSEEEMALAHAIAMQFMIGHSGEIEGLERS